MSDVNSCQFHAILERGILGDFITDLQIPGAFHCLHNRPAILQILRNRLCKRRFARTRRAGNQDTPTVIHQAFSCFPVQFVVIYRQFYDRTRCCYLESVGKWGAGDDNPHGTELDNCNSLSLYLYETTLLPLGCLYYLPAHRLHVLLLESAFAYLHYLKTAWLSLFCIRHASLPEMNAHDTFVKILTDAQFHGNLLGADVICLQPLRLRDMRLQAVRSEKYGTAFLGYLPYQGIYLPWPGYLLRGWTASHEVKVYLPLLMKCLQLDYLVQSTYAAFKALICLMLELRHDCLRYNYIGVLDLAGTYEFCYPPINYYRGIRNYFH